jgi:hypothetical protein
MILYMISCLISDMISQMDKAEKALKMKIRGIIRPMNAFLKCYNLEFWSALPREELHQFLISLLVYGEYIIPSAFHSK